MPALLLRRRKLGRGSCHGIRRNSDNVVLVCRNDVRERRARRNHPGEIQGYPSNIDTIIRWGCTAPVPDRFNIIQSADSIRQVNNKAAFRMALNNANPDLIPRTWLTVHDWLSSDNAPLSVILRPDHHAQGRHLLHLQFTSTAEARHDQRLANFIRRHPNYYISQFIQKVAEYRVFVVQGRVACVAQKTPGNPQDVAWNVARGGRFDHVRWNDWPLQVVRKAVEAFNVSSLDFGGVDVMVGPSNTSYIIEINSAPSLPLKSDGDPTHRQECMAKCIDWMLSNGRERIPLIQGRGGYTKFIHPAICEEARLV